MIHALAVFTGVCSCDMAISAAAAGNGEIMVRRNGVSGAQIKYAHCGNSTIRKLESGCCHTIVLAAAYMQIHAGANILRNAIFGFIAMTGGQGLFYKAFIQTRAYLLVMEQCIKIPLDVDWSVMEQYRFLL